MRTVSVVTFEGGGSNWATYPVEPHVALATGDKIGIDARGYAVAVTPPAADDMRWGSLGTAVRPVPALCTKEWYEMYKQELVRRGG